MKKIYIYIITQIGKHCVSDVESYTSKLNSK
jgi:hypothetical protein